MRFSLPLFALAFAFVSPAGAQTVILKPVDAGLRVDIDGQLFTEYHVKDVPRPFLYPLIGGAGENVVRNFPMVPDVPGEAKDHKHHRGLWFAHGSVNDMDFWSEEKSFGRQEHVEFKDISAKNNKASFVARTRWVAPNGKVQLTDSRKITVTALPGGEKYVDFDITLQATEGDVLFGDTKEGTMAIRLSPGLSIQGEGAAGKAFNSGTDENSAMWGKRANWAAYYGPDPKGNLVGVVMFEHPQNFRAPTWWHTRDYGLFAANPFGLHDFEGKRTEKHLGDYKLAKGESLTLRYRFYFAKGKPMPTPLAARFAEYAAQDLSTPPASAPFAPAPLTSIQTDGTQPRIQVLKDQGLNAMEWALAPLNDNLPPDIRQNMGLLREDLLDEAKKAPKANANAYALGSQYCEKLLLAIEERNQTRARAGYTAAQADADVRVTNQALDARRNYMMSWPQFSREQSQRAALERKERSGADLKKERSDLEWTTRTETLRKYLDDLYRQFREALR